MEEGLRALGIGPEDLNTVCEEPTFEGACAKLDAVKSKVRKAYRALAFELHPDRTGNDRLKTELFKVIGKIRADIEALQINRPPPLPIDFTVIVVQYGGVGRPPQGHPAANGGVRQWGSGSATTTVTTWPVGVRSPSGTRRR